MEVELISKKELLQLTNISYGQLYRWKRKNLIPEDWFIKKSVSTGQETFFPREQILERIEKIIELKDHPFFVATQAHPEFKSRPNRAHPLFYGFIKACNER